MGRVSAGLRARRRAQIAPIHPRTAPFGHPPSLFREPVLYPLSYEGTVPTYRDCVLLRLGSEFHESPIGC